MTPEEEHALKLAIQNVNMPEKNEDIFDWFLNIQDEFRIQNAKTRILK